jgi:hypothetical protein
VASSHATSPGELEKTFATGQLDAMLDLVTVKPFNTGRGYLPRPDFFCASVKKRYANNISMIFENSIASIGGIVRC